MKKTFAYFVSFYKPYKKMFFMDLACAACISLIDVSYPLIFRSCINGLFTEASSVILKGLLWVVPAMLAMYALKAACRYYVTYQGHIMGAYMESDMRQELFDQYQRLSFAYYDSHNTGHMMSRVVTDLFDIAELAHHGPENLFISLIKIVGSFGIMAFLNWRLTLVLLLVTCIMLWFSKTQNTKMRRTFKDNRKKMAEINASVQDSLSGIRVVQSFGNEDLESHKFARSNGRYLESKKRNYKAAGAYYTGNHFFQGLLYTTVIGAGGYLIAKGELAAADLSAFALYVNVFVSPLEILIELTEMFQKGFSGFERFEEVMKEIPDVQDAPDARELKEIHGDISLEDVQFSYNNDTEVLDHVSLTIPAGKNVALVGPSGGGKSTICSLIPRFYDVSAGAVKIDGQDVRQIQLKSLRNAVGIVQQDVYLFDGTIADNIRYGKPDATDQEIMEAARKANLASFIEELPNGLNTYVGERGTRLSGGQKQRISIARIFLKDPKILILDEATSALDNESENVVQQSLYELSKNRTCLTIAHRLSTIQNASEILVIDGNGIAERGTHEELLAKNGIYARYYNLQFEGR